MSALIPFDGGQLPAYLSQPNPALADINKEIVRASFPTMSIKGKVFTLSKDGVKTVLRKPGAEDADEVAQNIGVVITRASMTNKTFYLKGYAEGDSDNARPDCYSHDGVLPSAQSPNPQSTKCAVCPHNQWGSRVSADRPGQESKGKACSDNARLAIATPTKVDDPMLLRVPPASLKNLRDAVKLVNARKIPYNAVIMKIGFDATAASPTLTFKPVGILDDAGYAKVNEVYDSETVRAIVGLDDQGSHGEVVPANDGGEMLDAALAARNNAQAAQPEPTPAPTPAPTPKPTAAPKPPKATPAPTPAATTAPVQAAAVETEGGADSLLNDLDALLGTSDD